MSAAGREPGPSPGEKPGRLDPDALFDGEVLVILPEGLSLEETAEPEPAGGAPAAAARPCPVARPVPAQRPAALHRPAARPQQSAPAPALPAAAAGQASRESAAIEAAAATQVRYARAAGLLVAGLLGVLLAAGWRYYLTPPALRPFHFQHAALRPSGPIGLTLGILGTAVILATLGYVLRKRLFSWGRLGSLRGWMTWHVLAGIAGPAMILFHSAFAPASAAGLLAFGAMWVAVASGFVGRYIQVHIPRAPDGREIGFDDLRSRLDRYRKKLIELGADASLLPLPAATARERLWLLRALAAVLWGDRAARLDLEALRRALVESMDAGPERDQALRLARRLCEGRQSLARLREVRRLMAAWRFFHGWFVMILLAGIAFHVAIAVKYGGLWILGGRE